MSSILGLTTWLSQELPRELDDAIVRPGWLGLGMFLALVAACFFLFRSMLRQLKKVDFVEEPEERPATPPDPTQRPTNGGV